MLYLILKIKLFIKILLSYLPEKLPTGLSEMYIWMDSVIELANIKADAVSLRFALATMILHAENKAKYLSKNYFIIRLHKGAANQVASQVFQDIKAAQEAQKQFTAAEVTATPAVTNVSKPV